MSLKKNYSEHDMTYNSLSSAVHLKFSPELVTCLQRKLVKNIDYPIQEYLITLQLYAIFSIFDIQSLFNVLEQQLKKVPKGYWH